MVERHTITILASDLPTGAQARTEVARLHAEAYARARGFEITGLQAVAGSSTRPGSAFNGVTFELTVGKGDLALDQRVPGVLDRWTWSAGAVEWWQRRLGGPPAKLLSLVDDQGRRRTGRLTGIRPVEGDPGALSVEGEFVGSPGGFHGRWLGNDALNGLLGGHCYPPGLADAFNEEHQTLAADQRPPWAKRADPEWVDPDCDD